MDAKDMLAYRTINNQIFTSTSFVKTTNLVPGYLPKLNLDPKLEPEIHL